MIRWRTLMLNRGRILILPALMVLVGLQAAAGLGWFGSSDGARTAGGPFRLAAPDGHPVAAQDFRARWMLVYLGTTGSGTCAAMLRDIAAALDRLGGSARRVAPLFITLDPGRDTPAVMAAFMAGFDPRILGLTGNPDEIRRVAREYGVPAQPGMAGRDPVLVVMDPWGRFATILRDPAPDAVADTLRHLIR